jgi:D-threo-aldose 1-dehydrogenase
LSIDRLAAPIDEMLWPAPEHGSEQGTDLMLEGDARLILLHDDDNVLICARAIAAGEVLSGAGGSAIAREAIAIGHKVARGPFRPGDKVIKYGVPIGSMTASAEAGDWVHMHNMKSDYIASHTRAALEGGRS